MDRFFLLLLFLETKELGVNISFHFHSLANTTTTKGTYVSEGISGNESGENRESFLPLFSVISPCQPESEKKGEGARQETFFGELNRSSFHSL